MKLLNYLLLLFLYACSSSESINPTIAALNGTWISGCTLTGVNTINSTTQYTIFNFTFNNGEFTNSSKHYSDNNCININSDSNVYIGTASFVKDVITETGITATRINIEYITPVDLDPPIVEFLTYLDDNTLYFGSFDESEESYVIDYNRPFTKIN